MADGDDPIRPRPPAPGQPIPRLWKADPDPDDADKPVRKSRKERLAEERARAEGKEPPAQEKPRSKAKGSAKPKLAKDGKKPKGALIEATPESETYEARQRTRMLIGGGMLLVVGIGLLVLFRTLNPPPPPEEPSPDEGALMNAALAAPNKGPSPAELEAKILLDTARQLAKDGNTKGSIDLLNKVIASYPKTATAAEAREALTRPSRNLPLFLDRPTVVASPVQPPAKATTPAPVVNVAPATAPAVKPGAPSDASLNLPPNPVEAPRAPTPAATTTGPAAPAAKPLPAGFRARTEAGLHASGWPNQIVSDRDGATMVFIPAGSYAQGRDGAGPEEAPEHRVELSAYYIDQHEVTLRQFHFYLKETGKPLPARTATKGAAESDDLPAVNVTAREAWAYCEWAGKRLPTEAQWEAAARTPDGRLYPWGSNPPSWARPRAPRQIDPVMSFPLDQSPYGVFDLAGNAWEYVKDWYDPGYYRDLKGQLPPNPTGPSASRSRPPQIVVKGSSKSWIVSAREGIKVDGRFPYVGFRGVLSVEAPSAGSAASTAPATNQGAPPAMRANPGGISPF